MDFKSGFWQLELAPDLWYLTNFQFDGRLFKYKHFPIGLKPAKRELNTDFRPFSSHIKKGHLIHEDLIVAKNSYKVNMKVIEEAMQPISKERLTLNHKTCQFGCKTISFWGIT